jgi:hypothetical protein
VIETLELKPRISIRDSPAFRGLVFGAVLGLAVALCYLALLLVIGVFIAPVVDGLVTGYQVSVDLFTAMVALLSGAVGIVAGVLPAAVAGAVAGGVIGALLPLIARRRGPARAADDRSASRRTQAPSHADGIQTEWWVWLTGTVTNGLVGAAAVIIIAATTQDLVWTPTGLPIVWIPVLIFTLTGGPYALWLRGRSLHRRSAEKSAQPRRAAIPATDQAGRSEQAGRGQVST